MIRRRADIYSLIFMMVLYVPLGTLLHESGHILIAYLLGYKTQLHYASMSWYNAHMQPVSNVRDSFLITLGGNLLLDLVSIISLVVLLVKGKTIRRWFYWILVFLSMLIYRHILLTLIGLVILVLCRSLVSFGKDESEIASYLHLPGTFFGWGLFAVAIAAMSLLFLRVLDKSVRGTFFFAMCIGCPVGYIVWMFWLGPLLLP